MLEFEYIDEIYVANYFTFLKRLYFMKDIFTWLHKKIGFGTCDILINKHIMRNRNM